MATYRDIAATETDPGSPVTSTLMDALAENPVSIAEGGSGAPRHVLKSLERLTAGSSERSDQSFGLDGEGSTTDFSVFGFIQIGTVTVVATIASGVSVAKVKRRRDGSLTTLATNPASITVDVSVRPGDEIVLEINPTLTTVWDVSIRTGGESLWPGAAISVKNNDLS